ncbi:hypothetical protein FVE85_8477 [Porphyridium purpureum]|uniref:ARM repeat-containing protein n=1 Tax=Porphyridium purpureum TaxID=35688 RepID=A0A5J4YLH7_PORPP|nr:hypothetical protein FVE85_8477 [Porphyridium purpureum]|eukprot:POR8989..scf244_11
MASNPTAIHASTEYVVGVSPDTSSHPDLVWISSALGDTAASKQGVMDALDRIRKFPGEQLDLNLFLATGGMRLMCGATARFMDDELVQIHAAEMLETVLGEVRKAPAYLHEADGVPVLMQALYDWTRSQKVVSPLLGALRYATFLRDNRPVMIDMGVIEKIAYLMGEFDSNEIRLRGTYVLSNVSYGNVALKQRVGDSGVFSTMVKMMNSTEVAQVSEDHIVALFAAIRNLVFGSKKNQNTIYETGGIGAMCACAQAHLDRSELVDNAFAALGNSLFDNVPNVREFIDQRGVELIFKGVEAHPADLSLRENAFVLILLCARASSYSNAEVLDEILRHGTLKMIMETVSSESSSLLLKQKALLVIPQLSTLLDGLRQAREVGLLEVLVLELRKTVDKQPGEGQGTQGDKLPLAVGILSAMASLIPGDEENKSVLLRNKVLEITVEFLEQYIDDKAAAAQCLLLYDALFDDAEIRSDAEEKVIELIVKAMQLHNTDASIQEHGCGALYKIGIWGSVDPKLLSAPEVVQAVEYARESNKGSFAVESVANQFLMVLIQDSDANQRSGRNLGGGAGGAGMRSRSRTLGPGSSRSRPTKVS